MARPAMCLPLWQGLSWLLSCSICACTPELPLPRPYDVCCMLLPCRLCCTSYVLPSTLHPLLHARGLALSLLKPTALHTQLLLPLLGVHDQCSISSAINRCVDEAPLSLMIAFHCCVNVTVWSLPYPFCLLEHHARVPGVQASCGNLGARTSCPLLYTPCKLLLGPDSSYANRCDCAVQTD